MDKKYLPVWTDADETIVNELHQTLKIAPLVCRLLVQRNIQTFEQSKSFLRPFSQIASHQPQLLKGLPQATQRIMKAIQQNERILLYGDYDVDGTTSVAMCYLYLTRLGADLLYYLPNRFTEGYGVSEKGIYFAKENNCALIITLDCGITAHKAMDLAHQLGIDTIVVDHHLPTQELPKATIIINPKQPDCPYPYKELSACGVAFKLLAALKALQPNPIYLHDLLPFVTLSIACDIVQIRDENRYLYLLGLKELERTRLPGLIALKKINGINASPTLRDILFGIGPVINAAGRLAEASEAVRLMLAADWNIAHNYAVKLSELNKQRRAIEKEITSEAFIQASAQLEAYSKTQCLVVCSASWNKGVVGIVASKLMERFNLPALVLTKEENQWVGSGRSLRQINLYNELKKQENLLTKFGGHAYAVGISMPDENLVQFIEQINSSIQEQIAETDVNITEVEVNADVNFEQFTQTTLKILTQFEPYGPGNMRPVFHTSGAVISTYRSSRDGKHVFGRIKQNDIELSFVAFGFSEDYIKNKPLQAIAYVLNIELTAEEVYVPQLEIRQFFIN